MQLATASTTCQASGTTQLALVGASIAAPLVLASDTDMALSCTLRCSSGQLELASGRPGGARRVHMTAQASNAAALHFPASAAAAPSPALRLLLPAPGRVPLALSTGHVDASQQLHQPGSFLVHPAALDAMTHTAAALQGSQAAEAGVTRIPVGVSALLAPKPALTVQPSVAQRWCQGMLAGMLADGAALADFAMSAGSASASVQLAGFQAKVAGTAAQRAPRPADVEVQQPAHYMYSIDWQAEEQLQPAAAAAAVSGGAQQKRGWTMAGRSTAITAVFAGSASRTAAQAAAAATDGLELLQQRLPQMGSGSLSLQVQATTSQLASSVGGRAPAAAAAAASLAALVKGAGMEFKAVNLRSSSVDAAVTAAAFADPAVDAFGTAATSGAVLRAKLLRAPMAAVLANSHLMPLPRGSLADLKLVPHAKTAPGPGEIKVRSEAWAAVTCILSFIFLTTRSTAHLSFSAGLRTCGGPELP